MDSVHVTRRVRVTTRRRHVCQSTRNYVRISGRFTVCRTLLYAKDVRRRVIFYRRKRVGPKVNRVPGVSYAVGHREVLSNDRCDRLVGDRTTIFSLCEAVIRHGPHPYLANGSQRAIRSRVPISRQPIYVANSIGPAIRVTKGNSCLVQCGNVNCLWQGVFRSNVRLGAIFANRQEVGQAIDRRCLLTLVNRVDASVVFSSFAQGPNRARYGITSTLAFVDRFVGVDLDQCLRKDDYLRMVDLDQRRPKRIERVEGRFASLERTSTLRLCVGILRQCDVTPI